MITADNKQNVYAGEIVEIGPLATGFSNQMQWKRCPFVIGWQDTKGYEHYASFTTFGNAAEDVLKLKPGDNVYVSFNIQAKEYKGKWYTNLNAFKIEPAGVRKREKKVAEPEQDNNDLINQLRGFDDTQDETNYPF